MIKYGAILCQTDFVICHFVCHTAIRKFQNGIKRPHGTLLAWHSPQKKLPSHNSERSFSFNNCRCGHATLSKLFLYTLNKSNVYHTIGTTGTIHRAVATNRYRLHLVDADSRERSSLHAIDKNERS